MKGKQMRQCACCAEKNPDDAKVCCSCGWDLDLKVKIEIAGGPRHHCSTHLDTSESLIEEGEKNSEKNGQ
jgi:hypothetical protein